MTYELPEFMSGVFDPELVIETLRLQEKHVMADLVEGLNDEIYRLRHELERAHQRDQRRDKKMNKRKGRKK